MDKPFKLDQLLFFITCLLAWTLTGCGGELSPMPGPSSTANPSGTSPEPPSITPIPTTPSPMPTQFYGTHTAEADPRLDSYLFPDEIDPEIAQVIQLTLMERGLFKPRLGKYFTTYVLLCPLEKTADGQHIAYVFTRSQEFYVEGGGLKKAGGSQIPAALIMEKHPQGWHVELETPFTGGDWGTRLREIFPEDVRPLLANFPSLISEGIWQDLIQQAESYYGVEYTEGGEDYSYLGYTSTPPVVILTLTPTPTADLASLTPNIKASSLVTTTSVSIRVNLYDGVTREFQKGLVSADWHVYLYHRSPDGYYPLESGILLDGYKEYDGHSGHEFSLHISLEEMLSYAGGNRGLVYQVVDNQGDVFWQEEIYLGTDLRRTYFNAEGKDFPNNFPEDLDEGVFVGTPNLIANKEIPIFIPEDGGFIIQEPSGGFFSLSYQYRVPEITATAELQELSKALAFDLYLVNDSSSVYSLSLGGEVSGSSAVLSVNFPHSWLDQERFRSEEYLLVIQDQTGSFYRKIPFQFKPPG